MILTVLVQNAHLFRRLLIANIIGWTAQAGVASALWWFHYPPELHGTAEAITAVPVTILVVLLVFFLKVLMPKGREGDIVSSTETAQRVESRGRRGGRTKE